MKIHVDGKYYAELDYKIPETAHGQQQLIFPTKYRSQLKEYSKRDVSVLAYIGDIVFKKNILACKDYAA